MERMKFKSQKEARNYISQNLPGGAYTICPSYEDFAIIDTEEENKRLRKMSNENTIYCNIPFLRINGKFI